MKKIYILLFIIVVCVLAIGFSAKAQEETSSGILPNSPFYFLKNFVRQLRLTFTFNSVKKADLRLQFANEILEEAKKLAEKTGNQELFQKAIDKYERQMEKIQQQVEKFKNKEKDDMKIDEFANRFDKKIELHQQIMETLKEKLEDNPQALESVREAKQKTIQHLEQTKEKLIERFQSRERKCKNMCGDNQCQEVVCQAIGCPCAETKTTCPQDCKAEQGCQKDEDCGCGRNIKTGECSFGNKNYIDTKQQCPDFCTGFTGNLRIKCISNKCKQIEVSK